MVLDEFFEIENVQDYGIKAKKLLINIPKRLFYMLRPIIVQICALLVSPIMFTLFILSTSASLYVYKWLVKHKVDKSMKFFLKIILILKKTSFKLIKSPEGERIWRLPLEILFKVWIFQSWFWHGKIDFVNTWSLFEIIFWNVKNIGHEIVGIENIPAEGPAIIILFHAPLPIDFFYLGANIYYKKKRLIKVVAEREVFKKFGKNDKNKLRVIIIN